MWTAAEAQTIQPLLEGPVQLSVLCAGTYMREPESLYLPAARALPEPLGES